ncbi:sensor histidine kinase [Chloroflexota bacterium]
MPIRWRLTLWFALILCAILGLSGTIHYILLRNNLTEQLDSTLKAYTALVYDTVTSQELPEDFSYDDLRTKLPPINEFAHPGTYIQIIDKDGNVLVKSDNLGEQELPVNPSLIDKGFTNGTGVETLAAGDGARLRIMVSPLLLQEQELLLEVALSANYIDSTMGEVRWVIIISILLALALIAVLGGSIIRSALSPVRRITQTAKEIEEGHHLDRRVGYDGPVDEIGQLATTFDNMIEHLDVVFQSQKKFIADASHELRSPLTVMRGNLDLLKRNLSKEDRLESLRAIELETTRMTKIVDDLLLLAEVDSNKQELSENVKLKEVINDELERARPIAGKRQLVIQRQEDLTIKGDAHKLRRMLGNLLNNAIRYTPENGFIRLSLFQSGEWAYLKVSDTGIGIATEEQDYIFNRFYRVDKVRSRSKEGIGLGLALVKEIAEQHGGLVTVISQPGNGSTFTVQLRI